MPPYFDPETSSELILAQYPWFLAHWNSINLVNKAIFPHAVLFSGVAGTGREYYIHLLIKSLLCQQTKDDNIPCDNCQACKLFDSHNHADFSSLSILENKKTIGVDQIRDKIDWLGMSTLLDQKKVLFIANAEKLTPSASNAILKTLEEPPPNVVIILLTEFPRRLLATIRSRCIHYILQQPNRGEAIASLQSLFNDKKQIDKPSDKIIQVDDKTQHFLLDLCQNAPFKAFDLYHSGTLDLREGLLSEIKQIALNQMTPVLSAKKLFKLLKKEPVEHLIFWFHSLVLDFIRFKNLGNSHSLVNKDISDDLDSITKNCQLENLYELYDSLHSFYELTANQLNPQLLLETYLIKWEKCCLIK